MISCIIIDDELHARTLFKRIMMMTNYDVTIEGEADNLKDGIALAQKQQVDIIFLDINMPKENGLKVHLYKDQLPNKTKIVFITAYDEFAINAIRLSAFDYLLKPLQLDDLLSCLKRFEEELHSEKIALDAQLQNLTTNMHEAQQQLIVSSHHDTHFLHIDDIIYLQAEGMYCQFVLKEQIIWASKPLKHYLDILPFYFFRNHRSYIVNMKFVEKKLNADNEIVLWNNQTLPLARLRKSDFVQKIKELAHYM